MTYDHGWEDEEQTVECKASKQANKEGKQAAGKREETNGGNGRIKAERKRTNETINGSTGNVNK